MNPAPARDGFWMTVLKQGGVPGVVLLILVIFLTRSVTAQYNSLQTSMDSIRDAIWSLCELEARDLPFEQRSQFCRPSRSVTATDTQYLQFFSGTIAGGGLASNP